MSLGQLGTEARPLPETTKTNQQVIELIREYLEAYVWRHGQRGTAESSGVSRHTVWRFLYRDHVGRRLPRAVLESFGGNLLELVSATRKLNGKGPGLAFGADRTSLPDQFKETLLLVCSTSLTAVEELSGLDRVPGSTLRDRLARLTERGFVDSIQHRLSALGPHPRRRYFPTEEGVNAAAAESDEREDMLELYPVTRQWMRLLAEHLDSVAVLYHVAAMVADADQREKPARVDHFRHGPYDMPITLSEGRSIGLIRRRPALPTANLRYRLSSSERRGYSEEILVGPLLTLSSDAVRRAIRSFGESKEHVAFLEGHLAVYTALNPEGHRKSILTALRKDY